MKHYSSGSHRCQFCLRQYKRQEHLNRHLASHKSGRRYSCTACGSTFSRSDALGRHLRTCASRYHDVPKPSRRRACDRCVKAKRACNLAIPCQTCLNRGATCSYTAVDHYDSNASFPHDETFLPSELFIDVPWISADPFYLDFACASWNDFLSLNPNDFSANVETHLNFLDNFTKEAGLIKSFDCGTPALRQAAWEQFEIEANTELGPNSAQDPLTDLHANIIALICEVATCKPRNSAVDIAWSIKIETLCSTFFSPVEIQRKIKLYWSIWHPNVNILHMATFNVISAKPTLVAAMVVMGAAVSPSEIDRNNAGIWFNAVEEAVFIDDDFCDDTSTEEFPNLSKIQALQAAYIVCLYQNWDGSDKAKRRVRRHRFNALVSAVRDIGIAKAKHLDYKDHEYSTWTVFAAREQLIRVYQWVFLIDTAFVIFNNVPPHMVIKEMTCDLACCEGIFQAESSESWHKLLLQMQEVKQSSLAKQRLTLGQAAELLCKDDLGETVLEQLASAGPLNLFAITSSLHSMLFQHQNSFNAQSQLAPLRNSLENWKSTWTLYLQKYADTAEHSPLGHVMLDADNMWRRVGFVRYASDYWLLASLLLDRICVAQHPSANPKPNDEATPEEQQNRLVQPMLQKYDETSMQQVNELIAGFQRTSIS